MSKNSERKAIDIRITANFFSAFIGWGVMTHPIAIIIISYTDFFRQESQQLSKFSTLVIPRYFLHNYSKIELIIKQNSIFDYVEYMSGILVTFETMNNWFRQQEKIFQLAFFVASEKKEIEEIAEIFHVSKKSTASFIKTLKPLGPKNRAITFITWWDKRLSLEGVTAKGKNSAQVNYHLG